MFIDFLRPFFVSFLSIYIAIDITGKKSAFLSLTEKFSHRQKTKLIRHSVVSSIILTLGFVYIGKFLMLLMGISAADFKVAGGLLLFILATLMFVSNKSTAVDLKRFAHLGIIPIAAPLIATPALFIVSLLNFDRFGPVATLTMLLLNLGVVWLVLEKFQVFVKLMGERGIYSLSKILNILLAALAVMATRQGIIEILRR